MGSYLGIDLGTTFSAMATLDESGRPVMVSTPEGNFLASCVMFNKSGPVVGERARVALQLKDKAFGRFKREMGGSKTYRVDKDDLSPTDLSAIVLAELRKIAESKLSKIEKTVVTIPANFANEAREATMQAAKKAGLDVDVIVNEPTAAALYYAFKNDAKLGGNYVVYDLGGGTFDVSVMYASGQKLEVLASNGLSKLGGDDFDRVLVDVVRKKYEEITKEEMDELDYTLNQAEQDKISLSNRTRVLAGGDDEIGDGVHIQLRRSDFETAISALLAQTEMLCEATIEEAGLEFEDIQDVILVGGSTRIPAVKESVERVFGKTPIETQNVDEMVALGAALYAAYKSEGDGLNSTQRQSLQKMTVSECTNHCFGFIAQEYNENRSEWERINSVVIRKGEKIPCSIMEPFVTLHDDQQSVNCLITQSTSPETDPRFVKVIWEGQLELPSGRPAGQELEVTYSYDESELMHCRFHDLSSGNDKEVNISISESNETDSAIDKFLVE